jgi:hypothetical protein
MEDAFMEGVLQPMILLLMMPIAKPEVSMEAVFKKSLR